MKKITLGTKYAIDFHTRTNTFFLVSKTHFLALLADILLYCYNPDPTRPIGDLPYLFTKQGQKIRELQREISLRALVDSTTSTQVALANGGDEGLANLEAAQKIAASPSLLAQFKKDKEVAQKALVGAVAWLKDLRTAQDAEEAAAKVREKCIVLACWLPPCTHNSKWR